MSPRSFWEDQELPTVEQALSLIEQDSSMSDKAIFRPVRLSFGKQVHLRYVTGNQSQKEILP